MPSATPIVCASSLAEREEEVETMRSEVIALRKEREEVRTRVEKMLTPN